MWGRTYYSNDFNELMMAKRMGLKVIVIDDDAPEFKRLGCVVLSILLPPFESINAELNGDIQSAQGIYMQYLTSDICTQAFGAICTALYNGKDILFFISPDQAKNLNYGYVLMQFMQDVFGFPSGSMTYPNSGITSNEINHMINRYSTMYLMGYIPFEVFCAEFPRNIMPNIDCCMKMMANLQINPNQFGSPEQIMAFCRRYMDESIQQFQYARQQHLNPCPIYFDNGGEQ